MKIGLSLSGGGYRAAAFHLGTLRKLHNLKILDKIDFISTVSGGSIIGAYYCLYNSEFDKFEAEFTELLKSSIIKRVLLSLTFLKLLFVVTVFVVAIVYFLFFYALPWLGLFLILLLTFLLIKFQFLIFPVSKTIEKIYNKFFFKEHTLQEFKRIKPEIIICSTNLQTGRLFYFTRNKMSDSFYDDTYSKKENVQFDHENFPISRAVMCSSCFPFTFSPILIEKKFIKSIEGFNHIRPVLIDGGIYDNQGIHKLTHEGGEYDCDIVITSDAGNKLPFQGSYNNLITLLMRTSELFMNRIKLFQMMQNLYHNIDRSNREIAYISLGWDLKNCIPGFVKNLKNKKINESVIKAHGLENLLDPFNESEIVKIIINNTGYEELISKALSEEETKIARSVSTNLTSLSEKQILCLSKHAELQTELQLKLYCPSLFNPEGKISYISKNIT